jgi:ferredoxin
LLGLRTELGLYAHRKAPMKIQVDVDKCQGHARCNLLSPELFELDDFGHAQVLLEVVPRELEEKARQAVRNCPEVAISAD